MKERLNQILTLKKLSPAKFASIIGANPSTVSHILSGRNKPGADILRNIVEEFPDINMNWLLTGQGSWSNNPDEAQPTGDTSPGEATLFDFEIAEESAAPSGDAGAVPSQSSGASEPEPPSASPGLRPIPQGRKVKRIILFFDDGTFECYEK